MKSTALAWLNGTVDVSLLLSLFCVFMWHVRTTCYEVRNVVRVVLLQLFCLKTQQNWQTPVSVNWGLWPIGLAVHLQDLHQGRQLLVGTFYCCSYRSHLVDISPCPSPPPPLLTQLTGVISKVLRCDTCAVPAEGVHYSVIQEFGVSILLETFCQNRRVTAELL